MTNLSGFLKKSILRRWQQNGTTMHSGNSGFLWNLKKQIVVKLLQKMLVLGELKKNWQKYHSSMEVKWERGMNSFLIWGMSLRKSLTRHINLSWRVWPLHVNVTGTSRYAAVFGWLEIGHYEYRKGWTFCIWPTSVYKNVLGAFKHYQTRNLHIWKDNGVHSQDYNDLSQEEFKAKWLKKVL